MIDYLTKLNDVQYKAATTTEGPVLVISGAGSGKTRVLTARIAHLIMDNKVNPWNILAITFTNKAAKEMNERLQNMVPSTEGMWVSTIHSMCVRILRSNIDRLGYDKSFTIYDEQDKQRIVKRILKERNQCVDDRKDASGDYIKSISTAKTYFANPRDYFSSNGNNTKYISDKLQVFDAYEDFLRKSNALDFDDLLVKTLQLLVGYPDVKKYYATKFHYVHVDEFQDTNIIQYEIIKLLSSEYDNLFVVGDDDQSIYSWRGAQVDNILNFDREYPNASVFKLEQNYRSTKAILNAANLVIRNNKDRKKKTLWCDNEEGEKPLFYTAADQNAESYYVVNKIIELNLKGEKYSDMAVLMRVNALSNKIESDLITYGIPYKIYGGLKFNERKEIKDIYAYLKLIINPKDNESFLRIVNYPRRGIGDSTLDILKEAAEKDGLSLYEELDNVNMINLSGDKTKKLISFYMLMQELIDFSMEHSVPDTILHVIEKTGYRQTFDLTKDEDIDRDMNLSSMVNEAKDFIKANGDVSLIEYLTMTSLQSDADNINEGDYVTISSIHSVKGLEFNDVFIIGMEEGTFPISRAYDNDSDNQEERRLAYVAITRARKKLYLTRATCRMKYGNEEITTESPYIHEMEGGIEVVNPSMRGRNGYKQTSGYGNGYGYRNNNYQRGYSSSREYLSDDSLYSKPRPVNNTIQKPVESKQDTPSKPVNPTLGHYQPGQKVRHRNFGIGMVIAVKQSGCDQLVDVAFDKIGIKKFVASLAPMEVIKDGQDD